MLKLNLKFGLLICAICLINHNSSAQEDFAVIRKNVNVLAKDLHHDLNATKDTLILKSKKKMYKVYTIGDNYGVVNYDIKAFDLQVPLTNLKKGRYVFVVNHLYHKVVFQVTVQRNSNYSVNEIISEKAKTIETETPEEPKIETLPKLYKKVALKPYNISDLDRSNMQSREDAKREMRLKLAQKRLVVAGRARKKYK
jgi:hypothetical protein